ncbi:hypothetical protein LSAT2_000560 [Lamellibrachia satsuma]|nr:hypothetical protein LSAT2_000560 [Lamellibrachia satsuma]
MKARQCISPHCSIGTRHAGPSLCPWHGSASRLTAPSSHATPDPRSVRGLFLYTLHSMKARQCISPHCSIVTRHAGPSLCPWHGSASRLTAPSSHATPDPRSVRGLFLYTLHSMKARQCISPHCSIVTRHAGPSLCPWHGSASRLTAPSSHATPDPRSVRGLFLYTLHSMKARQCISPHCSIVTRHAGPSLCPLFVLVHTALYEGTAVHLASLLHRHTPRRTLALSVSGTTGNPKGVMLSHDNVTWTASMAVKATNLVPGEVSISYLPLSHIAAQIVDIYAPITSGVAVHFAQPDALKGSLSVTMREVRPTVFLGVPRVWEKMEEKMQDVGRSTGGLKKYIATWAKGIGYRGNMSLQRG